MHHEDTYYHAAQLVLKTEDRGLTWTEASPDLTRNIDEKQGNGGGPYTNEAVGAENYGTIAYLAESPHEKGVFWTGSDDGLVQLTRDDMATWINVTPKGLEECLVNAIEISPHDPGTAYIATTRYKFNNKTPGLYKTTNYGKSWTNISEGIPYGAYTRVVREDKKRKGLLYAGTETGVYISWNGGKSWEPFQLNLPITPINDLMVHNNDLIVATSGRSFWVLDDLHLLNQYEATGNNKLYKTAPVTYGMPRSAFDENFSNGKGTFTGINPASGVVIYYELQEIPKGEITLEIRDMNNHLINTISSERDSDYIGYAGGPQRAPVISKKAGLNRFVWNMRNPIMPGIPKAYIEASYNGHKVPPGVYSIRLNVGEESLQTQAIILDNPNYEMEEGRHKVYDEFMSEMESELTAMHRMVNELNRTKERITQILKGVDNEALKAECEALVKKLKSWDEEMVQRKSKAYDDVENFPNKFTAEYMFLINQTESSIPRVNQSSRDRRAELESQWAKLKTKGEVLINKEIPAFNKKLWQAGIGALFTK